DLKSDEPNHITQYVAGLPKGSSLKVHGYASEEGPAPFNLDLSCHRANKMASLLRAAAPAFPITDIVKHGATPGTPRSYYRSVVVEIVTPTPATPTSGAICGPDATDWFVAQVNAAKRDPIVLAIQQNLAGAHRVAARYGF